MASSNDTQQEPSPPSSSSAGTRRQGGGPPPRPYLVFVSQRFIILTLLSSILLAFAVGRTARIMLLERPQRVLLEHQRLLWEAKVARDQNRSDNDKRQQRNLPTPVLPLGRRLPKTSYTSKNFNTAVGSSTDSRWVLAEEGHAAGGTVDADNAGTCANVNGALDKDDGGEGSAECQDIAIEADKDDDDDDEEEEHEPKGQHLLIDIENVDGHFLNSEQRLASAMLQLVNQCGLTLLSYHCHQLEPVGVSCVGVLLESHVSFHTWPSEGVITLDLFTCGPNSLLPVVSFAESLFAVPRTSPSLVAEDGSWIPVWKQKPRMIWAHKDRGFQLDEAKGGYLENVDLMVIGMVSCMNDYKQEIASVDTPFQTVDIWDIMEPKKHSLDAYERSLTGDESYESQHPEFFRPDRLVFLDGVLQSRRSGDAGYHEGLVHPALFSHPHPKRVAIIGGGEGATLREVLKHNTIETVVMIEIDELMVKVSAEHLPEWSDCSNLVGSRPSCLDDPRAELHFADAFAWFTDRFLNEDGVLREEPFDVIIMDALDPQIEKDFLDGLYDEGPFLRSLPFALTENGIFVAQVGEAPDHVSPAEVHSNNKNRVRLINSLVNIGFPSMQEYELTHCGFEGTWQLLLAAKSSTSKSNFFSNEAAITREIRKRSLPTVDGESPFLYFDGATMMSLRYPHKNMETVFCRRNPMPESCKGGHGYDFELQNVPATFLEVPDASLEVRRSSGGWGVFATKHIAKQSYIGLEALVHSMYVEAATYKLALWSNKLTTNVVKDYISEWGSSTSTRGALPEIYAPASIHGFFDHGCEGTSNVGRPLNVTETSASLDSFPQELVLGKDSVHNPALARQAHFMFGAISQRDISPKEELRENYLGRYGNTPLEEWRYRVAHLRDECASPGHPDLSELCIEDE